MINLKGKYIEILNIPDFDKMDYYTYEEIKGPKKPNPFNYRLSKEDRKKAWESNPFKHHSGIYFLMNDIELIYIGKTTKLFQRVKSHKTSVTNPKDFDGLFLLPITEGWEMEVLEAIYIAMYQPKNNKQIIMEQ